MCCVAFARMLHLGQVCLLVVLLQKCCQACQAAVHSLMPEALALREVRTLCRREAKSQMICYTITCISRIQACASLQDSLYTRRE